MCNDILAMTYLHKNTCIKIFEQIYSNPNVPSDSFSEGYMSELILYLQYLFYILFHGSSSIAEDRTGRIDSFFSVDSPRVNSAESEDSLSDDSCVYDGTVAAGT